MWVIVAESVWGVVRLVGIVMRVNIASWHEAEREGQKRNSTAFHMRPIIMLLSQKIN